MQHADHALVVTPLMGSNARSRPDQSGHYERSNYFPKQYRNLSERINSREPSMAGEPLKMQPFCRADPHAARPAKARPICGLGGSVGSVEWNNANEQDSGR